MKKKAILFTLDSLLALLLVLSFFTYINFYLSEGNREDTNLLYLSNDVLAVLEKTNIFADFNSAQIQDYLDALPVQICANITLYNSENTILTSTLKSNCPVSEEKIITRRVFVSNFHPYLAIMGVWYLEQ